MKTSTLQSWQKVKIGEVADLQNGYAFKSRDFGRTGYPVLKIKSVASGRIIIDDNAKYSGSIEKLSRYLIAYGDILVTMTGSNISQINSAVGKVTQYREKFPALLNQRVGKIYPKKEFCINQFLFYVLSEFKVQEFWAKRASGAANQANISPDIIKSYEFALPPLLDQQMIADILSVYDDLIENNTRRITILESILQAIYTEWFDKFHFPDYKRVAMINSDNGKIPEGWKMESIIKTNIFSLISDNADNFAGYKTYYATADIDGIAITGKGEEVTFNNKPSRAQKIPRLFSVWFARMKDTYKVLGFSKVNSDIADRSILSSGFAGFSSEKEYFPYLYCTINSRSFHTTKNLYCTGATQMSLTNEGMDRIKILNPTKDVIIKYARITSPLLDELFLLQKHNSRLNEIRNSLLPKLVTGEIIVK